MLWGKPQAPKPEVKNQGGEAAKIISGMLPRAIVSQHQSEQQPQNSLEKPFLNYFNIPSSPPPSKKTYYPSMDPQRMGNVSPAQELAKVNKAQKMKEMMVNILIRLHTGLQMVPTMDHNYLKKANIITIMGILLDPCHHINNIHHINQPNHHH